MADVTIAEEAQKLLDDAGQDSLEGLEADTKVTVLNMNFATADTFVLGQRVELRVVGYVTFDGDELLENEGKRHLTKMKAQLIEVVGTGEDDGLE